MTTIIHLDQPTTFKELVKLYSKKGAKYDKALQDNKARYKASMDELLGRNQEQETEAA